MTSDLVQKVAGLVAEVETTELAKVLEAVRATAKDARQARRVVERRAPAALRTALSDLFAEDEFGRTLDLLEVSMGAVAGVRQQLGVTGVVWTGPPTKALHARPTRAVVLELIQRAHTSVTIVTYAGHDIADLIEVLDEARLKRDVSVRAIIETAADSPQGKGPDTTKALKHLPLAVPIYRWPSEQRGAKGGSMHVKCVVRDRREVLVSSANLTSAALDRNMELGLVVDGGHTAKLIEQHYDDLIQSGVLMELETAG